MSDSNLGTNPDWNPQGYIDEYMGWVPNPGYVAPPPPRTAATPEMGGYWKWNPLANTWVEAGVDPSQPGSFPEGRTLNQLYGPVSRDQFLTNWYNPYSSVAGIRHPDEFLSALESPEMAQARMVMAGSDDPNQAGRASNDAMITAQLLQQYMNQPALLAQRGGQQFNWQDNPQLVNLVAQGQAAAKQQAQGSFDVNTAGTDWGSLALGALSVWGGGALLGGALGGGLAGAGAAGLGEAGLAGAEAAGLGGGALAGAEGAIPWSQAFAGSELGGSLLPLGAEGAGGAMGWADVLSQFGGLESLGGLNAAELAGLGVTPESLGLVSGLGSGLGNTGLEEYFTDFGSNFGSTGEGMFPTGGETFPGAWGQVGGGSWWDTLTDTLSNIPNPFSGGGGAGGGAGGSPWGVNQGGILGGLLGGAQNNMGSLLGLAPIIGGLGYAYNQTGFDTGRLEDLYGQYKPESQAYLYDQNTLGGRDALTSGLARRGMTGSSFANMDLTNYNTQRDLGRQALISQAVPGAAGIANNILNANVAERALKNDLIGKGLLAVGNLFGGRR